MAITLCSLSIGVFVVVSAFRYLCHRPDEEESIERPWMQYDWRWPLTLMERREARVRAADVACLTLGEETWANLVRDGYLDVPSAAEHDTWYRLRPARRVEIRRQAQPGTSGDVWRTSGYLCVYPRYELPAVEFLAQLYLLLRDDEPHVLATGQIQRYDGSIPNVF